MRAKRFFQVAVILSLLIPFAWFALPAMIVFVIVMCVLFQRTRDARHAVRLVLVTPLIYVPAGLVWHTAQYLIIQSRDARALDMGELATYLIAFTALSLIVAYLYLGVVSTSFYLLYKYGFISDLRPESARA